MEHILLGQAGGYKINPIDLYVNRLPDSRIIFRSQLRINVEPTPAKQLYFRWRCQVHIYGW